MHPAKRLHLEIMERISGILCVTVDKTEMNSENDEYISLSLVFLPSPLRLYLSFISCAEVSEIMCESKKVFSNDVGVYTCAVVYTSIASLASHTPQSQGERGSGDYAYNELYQR